MRCGTLGTSGHLPAPKRLRQAGVTAKSSLSASRMRQAGICKMGVLYKSGAYALKVTCLTLGDLSCALEHRERGVLAEEGAILPDRTGEVSRRHSR